VRRNLEHLHPRKRRMTTKVVSGLSRVDRGECNAERLAEIAFHEWTGAERSAIGDRWATR
jgi:hypothetical protein